MPRPETEDDFKEMTIEALRQDIFDQMDEIKEDMKGALTFKTRSKASRKRVGTLTKALKIWRAKSIEFDKQ